VTKKIYRDLREQMDQYSFGFPATASGIELRILEQLFTEEEAKMYLNLSMKLETPEAVAKRIGRNLDQAAALLERMFERGLIFRLKTGDSIKYAAVAFVVGSFEYQLKTMDEEFADLYDRYLLEAFGKDGVAVGPPLRTIPVNKSISHAWPVAPYDDVKRIFASKEAICVADCICRVQRGLLKSGCDKPLEVCFQFGSHAQYYVDRGLGRFITLEEALHIIDQCEEAGLVPQPFISQDSGGLCNCCGDCCQVLRSIKLHPKPAEKVLSNHYVEVNPDSCSGCETCISRCQMEAIKIGTDDVAEVDLDRCIGCGLCVTTCPDEALLLKVKPESERREPPATGRDYLMQLASMRGTSLIPLAFSKQAK